MVYPRCWGLDVHLKHVTACLLVSEPDQPMPRKVGRTGSTMPADLLALGDWLATEGCPHVAMESSGVYWKPVWNVLEDRCTLLLVNAQHGKQVPGRKPDVRDAEWLADLLRHGLLRGSFVPDPPQRELRDLTRLRTTRVRARARELNRLLKTLEGTGLKLGVVASEIAGVSARRILTAIRAGETDPVALADLAKGRLRAKLPELERALAAVPSPHHRFLIAEHLAMLDDLDGVIARLDTLIAERVAPCDDALVRLDTMPGVGRRVAAGLVAEIGTDMRRFPTSKHLASWAGLCPGNTLSAGKPGTGKTRQGDKWLRALLCEAAQAAARPKGTYLRAQYHRLVTQRGKPQAPLAVAHSILVRAYCLLRDGTTYDEPGGNYFDQRDEVAGRRRLVRRLERLGYDVTVTPHIAA